MGDDKTGEAGDPAQGAMRAEKRRAALDFFQENFSLPGMEAWSNSSRTVLINVLFLVTVIVVLPVLVAQFRRDQVVIEPIAVPQALIDQGLTADVAASRLWDGMKDVRESAATAKASIDAVPSAQQVEFSFPDSGLSIESLVFHVRRLFNAYETRVAGEITCADPACARAGMQLRLRVIRDDVDIIELPPMGADAERAYFKEAAEGVMSLLDPFVAMASVARDRPIQALSIGYGHIRAGHADAKWFYDQVGRIHTVDGAMPDAVSAFREAIRLDRNFLQARAGLAEALFRGGDTSGAEGELDFIRRRDPENVAMLYLSSAMAQARGDAAGAVQFLLRAAAARPKDPQYLAEAGALEMKSGNREEGERLLHQALQLDPRHPLAFASLAIPYMEEGDYETATRLFRNATDFNPDDARAQAAYANMLARTRNWSEALERYSRALALEPTNNAYAIQVAICLQNLGQNEKALVLFREALDREPDKAEIFRLMADSLRTLDRKPEALAAYRKFLELDRPDPKASEAEKVLAEGQREIVQGWVRILSDPEAQ